MLYAVHVRLFVCVRVCDGFCACGHVMSLWASAIPQVLIIIHIWLAKACCCAAHSDERRTVTWARELGTLGTSAQQLFIITIGNPVCRPRCAF